MQTELEQRHFVIHLRITMVTKSAKINFHILTPYSVLPFQSLWKHCIFNVSCHFELPEHFACWVELLAVGGTLCYFLYWRFRLLKLALRTTHILKDAFYCPRILNEFWAPANLESVLNFTLDSSCLGVLDHQFALLRDNVHVLLSGPCPSHHSSVFFSLDVSTE